MKTRQALLILATSLLAVVTFTLTSTAGGPREQNVLYTVTGLDSFDLLGISLVTLEDVNYDGVRDFAAGAIQSQTANPESKGYVMVFSGRDGETLHVLRGERRGDSFGSSIGLLGDHDGDGVGDLCISTGRGVLSVYSPVTGREILGLSPADEFPRIPGGFFDPPLVRVGDLDGDGTEDIVFSDWRFQRPDESVLKPIGRTTVYSGSDLRPGWSRFGGWLNARLGRALVRIEDLDGDELPEIATTVVGQSLRSTHILILDGDTGETIRRVGEALQAVDLRRLFTLGDLTGDGIPEFGAHADFPERDRRRGRGRAFIFNGATFDVVHRFEGFDSSFPGFEGDRLGHTMADAGDVDADGIPDFLLGTDRASFAERGRGAFARVYLHSGASGRMLAVFEAKGTTFADSPVTWVAGLGDANGDGTTEFLMSSARHPDEPREAWSSGQVRAISYDHDAPTFIRGDVNGDRRLNVSDAVAFLRLLFIEPADHPCPLALDVNANNRIDINDVIVILTSIFDGAMAPAAPYPDCARYGGPATWRFDCQVSTCTP